MDQYEHIANQFLIRKGLKTLESNFSCAGGEIDIISWHGNELVFVEVKFRSDVDYGHPLEFVTPSKISKIRRTAQHYLLKHFPETEPWVRFDVISLLPKNNSPSSQHHKDKNIELFDAFAIEWIQAAF